jgi:hypothetical protein
MCSWDLCPFYFSHVAEQIFHATSGSGFTAILCEREIRANRGEREFTFHQSSFSFARSMGYVALFDFLNCSQEKIAVMAHVWTRLVAKHQPALLLLLDPAKLSTSLITSQSANLDFADAEFMKHNYHVPRVEAWVAERIPLSFCMRVLRIDWKSESVDTIQLPEI